MYHDKINHSNCFKFFSLKGTYLQELQSYTWYKHDCTNLFTDRMSPSMNGPYLTMQHKEGLSNGVWFLTLILNQKFKRVNWCKTFNNKSFNVTMLVFVTAQKLFQNMYLSSTFLFVAEAIQYHHRSLWTMPPNKKNGIFSF